MIGMRPRSRSLLCASLIAWLFGSGCDAPVVPASNLVLINIDTLRADHLGAWGHGRATSPNLDSLAAESAVFERARSQSSWTLPSTASVMTSLYISTHRCTEYASVLAESYTTLAETLRDQSFVTGAVVTHRFVGSLHGLDQGFQHFDEEMVFEDVADSHLAITSPRVTKKGLEWLGERAREESRFFLWLHYFDPHAVYLDHPDLSVDFPIESKEDRYDGEIAFTDRAIGELLHGIDRLGLADDTLVVVIADHGEEFGDHGGTGHGRSVYREVVHVPFMIRIPGHGHRRVREIVRMVDVVPTVLELLGIDTEGTVNASDWEGVSLVGGILGRSLPELAAISQLGGRKLLVDSIERGRWKLILNQSSGEIGLFDVVSDPLESENLALDQPRIVGALERELSDVIAAAEEKANHYAETAPTEFSKEEIEGLRKLGYVE